MKQFNQKLKQKKLSQTKPKTSTKKKMQKFFFKKESKLFNEFFY
jgi:hypothetical protein